MLRKTEAPYPVRNRLRDIVVSEQFRRQVRGKCAVHVCNPESDCEIVFSRSFRQSYLTYCVHYRVHFAAKYGSTL